MPRIRSLKPEHKQHRKIGALSDFDYRLWVGMITEADDEGRLVADPGQLRALIFGLQPMVSLEQVTEGLERLASLGSIRLYFIHCTMYAVFQSWSEHQRIDKPKPSRLPSPPRSYRPRRIAERSPKRREPSPTSLAGSDQGSDLIKDQGSEGIGSDRKGGEPEGRKGEATPDTPGSPPALRSPEGLAPAARGNGAVPDPYETLARVTGKTADEIRREADELRARQRR